MAGKPPKYRLTVGREAKMAAELADEYRQMEDHDAAAIMNREATEESKAAIEERRPEVEQKGIAGMEDNRPVTVRRPLSTNGGRTRRNTSSGGDIVTCLLTIRNQVKLYHWQTGSFARHKATDDLTAALDLNIDAFVESYMGRYGRPKVSGSIKLHNFSESAARAFVAKQTRYLSTVLPKKIKKTDTDLLNLRDTILGDLNKVLYLFTLA
jgi:hypothetical protein